MLSQGAGVRVSSLFYCSLEIIGILVSFYLCIYFISKSRRSIIIYQVLTLWPS